MAIRSRTTVALAVFLGGCGGEEPTPLWVTPTLLEPGPTVERISFALAAWNADAPLGLNFASDGEGGVWIEQRIDRADWKSDAETDSAWIPWSLLPECLREGAGPGGAARDKGRLRTADGLIPADSRKAGEGAVFLVRPRGLGLRLLAGGVPPEECHYGRRVEVSTSLADDRLPRIRLGQQSASGFLVTSNEPVVLDVPEASLAGSRTLRFGVSFQSLLPELSGDARLVVRRDDSVLATFALNADANQGRVHPCTVPIPAGQSPSSTASRWSIELDGYASFALLVDPVFGPSEIGTYGERPWKEQRRDVIVYLADTFRADNLAALGGDPQTTPFLNRLAEQGVSFTQARSTSVWTLPSHGSLFTGLEPPRHGADRTSHALSDEALTIAEVLRDAGYRTGAVTDAGFVSQRFGLDQGFSAFQENPKRALSKTHAQALEFLDRDDGRPVFLFVHTYRPHDPYRPESDDDASEYKQLLAASFPNRNPRTAPNEARAAFARGAEELYRLGVNALDGALAGFHRELERRAVLQHGVFIFTSDHGEAFFEHGDVGHDGAAFDEKIRVPLLFLGEGFEPGQRHEPVSLQRLPATLARLARVAAVPAWAPTSLFDPAPDLPIIAFHRKGAAAGGILILEQKKLHLAGGADGTPLQELTLAFDLESDPAENQDQSTAAAWPGEILERARPYLERALRQEIAGETVELSGGTLADLRALGYVE